MKKIVTIVGARPQFIKMALVSKALKSRRIKEIVIHTGQHYDKNLSDIFFKELNIPRPAYNLGVGSGLHGEQTAKMLIGIEKLLLQEKPNIILVYGDTNSTLAGALAAVKLGICVAHVEAGLRSFNPNMPEETNRVITDSISSIFFCPTKESVDNLRREGQTRGVYRVGDVMYDSIKRYASSFNNRNKSGEYMLCTIHRAENTDNADKLRRIFKTLGLIKKRIIMPLHPRTEKLLKEYKIRLSDNVKIIKPVSYREMLNLERHAKLIITDSGGVQKEAFIFNIPCVTLRTETEWVETVENRSNVITGISENKILSAINNVSRVRKNVNPEEFYGDGFAYKRIADILAAELTKI